MTKKRPWGLAAAAAVVAGTLVTATAWAQITVKPRAEASNSEELRSLLNLLQSQSCIEDIPAPTLLTEPRFTKGASNMICFRLPSGEMISYAADTVRSPFVITVVGDESGAPALEFPRPVDLESTETLTEIVAGLQAGTRYSYSTALFLPVCKIDCDAVTDSTQLELHCSAYQDTVWSIQDNSPPEIQSVSIPQLDQSSVAGWSNLSTIQVQGDLSDPAGIWQAYLYRRNCGETTWVQSVADTTYPSSASESGFLFSDLVQFSVQQTLPDGCYEFRIEGKDATHTPESCFPDFVLAGNGGVPAPDAEHHVRINIDTRAPTSVNPSCEQIFNTISLTWSPAQDPNPGVGLAGYRVFRDGNLLDSIPASQNSYDDVFPPNTPNSDLVYQIQPFDSLGNTQTVGGLAECHFQVVSQVAMIAEPEYTAGTENEVCWTGSPNIVSYTLFMAPDCDYPNASQFTLTDTCFTFSDLQDGVSYCYWVEAVDEQQRVVYSDTVRSTQDATLPVIVGFEVVQKQTLSGRDWTTSRDLEIAVLASDSSPGVLSRLQLFENGVEWLSDDLEGSANLDATFSRSLQGAECAAIELSVQVTDAAGNVSAVASAMISLDATPPEPIANLTCAQLGGENGVEIEWNAAQDPGTCSGLAGYQLLRDGNAIVTLAADAVRFEDLFAATTPSSQFTYRVQPFDSLGNAQVDGPSAVCDYVGTSSIILDDLAKFTPGLSNEICLAVSGSLARLTVFADEGDDGLADDSLRVENPASSICRLFESLSDGQKYAYWAVGVDQQQRTVNSNIVRSIQDNTPPTIDSFVLPQADTLDGQIWVYGESVDLRVVARDTPPGEIHFLEVYENAQSTGVIGVTTPSGQLDRLFSYDFVSPIGQLSRIELAVRAIDGAGNVSELRALSINAQEALPAMFAFPNPFNPMNGGLTIRLDDNGETEVKIFDFFGNLVRTLTQKANSRDFVWDGRNGSGEIVANGGYVCVGTRTKARFKIGIMKRR